MYIAVVLLTMLILPAGSVWLDHAAHPAAALMLLVGKWFVFWGVGVRLGTAGLRQMLQPGFTAREIFHMKSDEALLLITELGVSNVCAGAIGLLSLAAPGFVLPSALYAAIFYGVAGIRHVVQRGKSFNETLAMVSDLFIAVVLAAFAVFAISSAHGAIFTAFTVQAA